MFSLTRPNPWVYRPEGRLLEGERETYVIHGSPTMFLLVPLDYYLQRIRERAEAALRWGFISAGLLALLGLTLAALVLRSVGYGVLTLAFVAFLAGVFFYGRRTGRHLLHPALLLLAGVIVCSRFIWFIMDLLY